MTNYDDTSSVAYSFVDVASTISFEDIGSLTDDESELEWTFVQDTTINANDDSSSTLLVW